MDKAGQWTLGQYITVKLPLTPRFILNTLEGVAKHPDFLDPPRGILARAGTNRSFIRVCIKMIQAALRKGVFLGPRGGAEWASTQEIKNVFHIRKYLCKPMIDSDYKVAKHAWGPSGCGTQLPKLGVWS